MLRKMYQGGSSRKQGPRLAMRVADDEPPRDAPVRPCEWPSENFMDRAGIKEEFNAYLRNADLVSFEAEKSRQYHYLTINGKDEACHMCVADLSILRSAVLGDKSYNLGAIVARRLQLNRFNGDFFGGIYATRIANFLGIAIREDDIELPPAYLDFNAMVHHQYVERSESPLQYRLIFDRHRVVHITLPAPAFFDHQAKGRYTITREEADEYERRAEAARRHTAAQEAIAAAS